MGKHQQLLLNCMDIKINTSFNILIMVLALMSILHHKVLVLKMLKNGYAIIREVTILKVVSIKVP